MIKRMILMVLCGTSAMATTRYVDLNSPNPESPYTSWGTAANDIQSAVDAATAGDTVVVTNGTYILSAEIVVDKAIVIESIEGQEATIVDADAQGACFALKNHASTLKGFTLQNGTGHHIGNEYQGGAVQCTGGTPVVIDCLIQNNSARYGGGVFKGTSVNCTFIRNYGYTATGIYDGNASNCTFIGHSSSGPVRCS